MKSRTVLALLAAVLVAACSTGGGATPSPSVAPPPSQAATSPSAEASSAPSVKPAALTIFGAASLKGALDDAKAAYEAANPGSTITVSTDSSSALETQIEQGAPADVFLSADTTNPKKLVDGGLAAGDADRLRRQQAHDHCPEGQPGRHLVAGGPREAGPEGHRRGRRGPDHEVRNAAGRRTWPVSPAIRPTSRRSTPRTSRRRRTTSRRSSARSSWARVTPGSST